MMHLTVTLSALEVSHFMRYTNLRFTYLFTYSLTYTKYARNTKVSSYLDQPRGKLYEWFINNIIPDLLDDQNGLWWWSPFQDLTARILYRPVAKMHKSAHHWATTIKKWWPPGQIYNLVNAAIIT